MPLRLLFARNVTPRLQSIWPDLAGLAKLAKWRVAIARWTNAGLWKVFMLRCGNLESLLPSYPVDGDNEFGCATACGTGPLHAIFVHDRWPWLTEVVVWPLRFRKNVRETFVSHGMTHATWKLFFKSRNYLSCRHFLPVTRMNFGNVVLCDLF